MRPQGDHSFTDLHEKARLALNDDRTVIIAIKADTPNSAENIAKRQKFGKAKRLSVAALARIKKKEPDKFWNLKEVITNFPNLSSTEKESILAELPEKNRKTLEVKRERSPKDGK